MNKLFWTGITFQIIQFSILGIILLSSLDWSFLTTKFFIISGIALMNVVSLVFILIGALRDDCIY
jgi:hypothetical protein